MLQATFSSIFSIDFMNDCNEVTILESECHICVSQN